uniref:Uncharacterized protein n=1 Tax=Morchella brunnea TaxID=1174671 RepID=A0A8K1MET2_9PEZI|nr:hypothetical protein LK370_mgp020 [Morchella brunnea]UBU98464.1 hypothetical protein [Morchella brunnea]
MLQRAYNLRSRGAPLLSFHSSLFPFFWPVWYTRKGEFKKVCISPPPPPPIRNTFKGQEAGIKGPGIHGTPILKYSFPWIPSYPFFVKKNCAAALVGGLFCLCHYSFSCPACSPLLFTAFSSLTPPIGPAGSPACRYGRKGKEANPKEWIPDDP